MTKHNRKDLQFVDRPQRGRKRKYRRNSFFQSPGLSEISKTEFILRRKKNKYRLNFYFLLFTNTTFTFHSRKVIVSRLAFTAVLSIYPNMELHKTTYTNTQKHKYKIHKYSDTWLPVHQKMEKKISDASRLEFCCCCCPSIRISQTCLCTCQGRYSHHKSNLRLNRNIDRTLQKY